MDRDNWREQGAGDRGLKIGGSVAARQKGATLKACMYACQVLQYQLPEESLVEAQEGLQTTSCRETR